MIYTSKVRQLVDYVNDRTSGVKGDFSQRKVRSWALPKQSTFSRQETLRDRRAKSLVAFNLIAILASILRAKHPIVPEESAFKVAAYSKRLLNRLDPELHSDIDRVLANNPRDRGRYNVNGIEVFTKYKILSNFTSATANKLRSKLKMLNKRTCGFSSNYKLVENWCSAIGLPIDLVRLSDADLIDLLLYKLN